MFRSSSPLNEEACSVFVKRCWTKEAYARTDAMLALGRPEEGLAITVRDCFVAQALVGLLQWPMYAETWREFDERHWVQAGFEWADAMLAVSRSEEGEAV
jgi:hypothetical protein